MYTEDEKFALLSAFMKDMGTSHPDDSQLREMRLISRWREVPLSRSFSLRPSELAYLNTFTSIVEGMKFLIRESIARHVSAENRELLRQLDFAAKIESNRKPHTPRQRLEREKLREELLRIGQEGDDAISD